jgi:hypothetical protein
MPFIISLLSAIVLGALNGFTSYSCGLSFVIELMAFSLWIMIIDSWGTLLDKKINAVFVLLSGIIMVPFINWIAKIVFYPASAYTLSTACMHIIIGAFGIAWFFIHFKIGTQIRSYSRSYSAPPAPPIPLQFCASCAGTDSARRSLHSSAVPQRFIFIHRRSPKVLRCNIRQITVALHEIMLIVNRNPAKAFSGGQSTHSLNAFFFDSFCLLVKTQAQFLQSFSTSPKTV